MFAGMVPSQSGLLIPVFPDYVREITVWKIFLHQNHTSVSVSYLDNRIQVLVYVLLSYLIY